MSANQDETKHYHHEALMRYARMLNFGNIHTKIDPQTGLHAIIAVHNIELGPAIGGCRFYPYRSSGPAMVDSLRLAFMMTLKAAACNLAHGGAKAVIIQPRHSFDRAKLFRAFGDFVHEINGRYITACDVGTNTDDMDVIASRTPYVIGAAKTNTFDSAPGPHTAKGVFLGIKAATQFKLKKESLNGIKVAIQGAGSVGYRLTKMLVQEGAIVTVSDTKPSVIQELKTHFGTHTVSVDDIYDVDCDVFAPCALGGTINLDTVHRIKASIIAGSANNQLSHKRVADILLKKDVLYAPDFVINAGGLINAALVYDYQDPQMADDKINQLYDTLMTIFEQSAQRKLNTLEIAKEIAIRRLKTAKKNNLKIENQYLKALETK